MLGCETEFIASFEDQNGYPLVLNAGRILDGIRREKMSSILGTDGCQYLFEFRSIPSANVSEIIGWFEKELERLLPHLPTYVKLLSIPYLFVPGERMLFCGGHIHFDLTHRMGETGYNTLLEYMMNLMDTACVEDFQDLIYPKHKFRTANGTYGSKYKDDRGEGMRRKNHGAEYRSCMTFSAYPQLMWAYMTIGNMVYKTAAIEQDYAPENLKDLCRKYFKNSSSELRTGIKCIERCLNEAPMDLYIDMIETWEIKKPT